MSDSQIPVNKALLNRVDKAIRGTRTSRSAFVAQALRDALRRRELERKHLEGYRKHPVQPGEFDVWEKEQVWGEP